MTEIYNLSDKGISMSEDLNNIIFNSIEISSVASRTYHNAVQLMVDGVDEGEIYAYVKNAIEVFHSCNGMDNPVEFTLEESNRLSDMGISTGIDLEQFKLKV